MHTCQRFDLEPASPLLRLWGHLIDRLVGIILILAMVVFHPDEASEYGFLAPTLFIGFLVIQTGMMAEGTTLGKRILKLKVYGKKSLVSLAFRKMLFREIIGKSISGIAMGLGFLAALKDKNKQGWHDKLVGSIVCKEDWR